MGNVLFSQNYNMWFLKYMWLTRKRKCTENAWSRNIRKERQCPYVVKFSPCSRVTEKVSKASSRKSHQHASNCSINNGTEWLTLYLAHAPSHETPSLKDIYHSIFTASIVRIWQHFRRKEGTKGNWWVLSACMEIFLSIPHSFLKKSA